jgi:hypothetical protein
MPFERFMVIPSTVDCSALDFGSSSGHAECYFSYFQEPLKYVFDMLARGVFSRR